MPRIEAIGVYPIDAPEPVHLVELLIHGASGVFNLSGITQANPDLSRDNWQVPYLEQILTASGDEIVADDSEADDKPELWHGNVRLVFFFHYLDIDRPLQTPYGHVRLPAPSRRPGRLSMVQYAQP